MLVQTCKEGECFMGSLRAWAVAAGLIVVTSLGGCAIAPAAGGKTPPPAAHATSTPAGAAVVAPKSRIPLDCAGVADPAAVAAVDPALVTAASTASAPTIGDAAARQAGDLSCHWSAGGATVTSFLAIAVSPDPAAGVADAAQEQMKPLGIGASSWGSCSEGDGCRASVVSGGYWFYVDFGPGASGQRTPDDVLRGLVTSVMGKLTAAGAPLPAWTPPTTVWSPAATCSDLGAAVPMTDVMASGAGAAGQWNAPGDDDPIDQSATSDAVFTNCAYQWSDAPANQGTLIVQVLPGAEWVWPQLEKATGVTATALTVPGATAAAYRCETGTSCWADAIIDHSWVHVSTTSTVLPDAQGKLTAALTALAAYRGAK